MDYQKTLEDLEEVLTELVEENRHVPVIVEGDKDTQALRKLHLTGEIIQYNKGMSLAAFCDRVCQTFDSVILLTDWDRRGGYLHATLKRNLECRVRCITRYREAIGKRCLVRSVEGLPAWLGTLRTKAAAQVANR